MLGIIISILCLLWEKKVHALNLPNLFLGEHSLPDLMFIFNVNSFIDCLFLPFYLSSCSWINRVINVVIHSTIFLSFSSSSTPFCDPIFLLHHVPLDIQSTFVLSFIYLFNHSFLYLLIEYSLPYWPFIQSMLTQNLFCGLQLAIIVSCLLYHSSFLSVTEIRNWLDI